MFPLSRGRKVFDRLCFVVISKYEIDLVVGERLSSFPLTNLRICEILSPLKELNKHSKTVHSQKEIRVERSG